MNAFRKFWRRLSGQEARELNAKLDWYCRTLQEQADSAKRDRQMIRDVLTHEKYELEKKLALVSKEHFERGANLKGAFDRIIDDLANESQP